MAANCASSHAGTRRGRDAGIEEEKTAVGSQGLLGIGANPRKTGTELDRKGGHRLVESGSQEAGEGGHKRCKEAAGGGGGGAKSVMWNGAGQICIPTAEEEGLPLPAAMTLRFLAAMDEGYVGSMREENARSKKKKDGAG